MLIYFLQYEFISLFRHPKEAKAKSLFNPSWLYAEGEKVYGFFLKKSVAKFSCRSERFAKLAADVNICIVLENERSLKKLLVKTKIVYRLKNYLFLGRIGKAQ